MATTWKISGIKQPGTFTVLGQQCVKVTVAMPATSGEGTEGVDFLLPVTGAVEAGDGGDGETVFELPAGTTVFRSVLQPVALGESVGPTAIPSSAPAEVAWGMIGTLALPAS